MKKQIIALAAFAMAFAGATSAKAVEINYLGWYDETIAKVIEQYEAATGNTVNYKNFDSNDQAFNIVRAAPGDWDLVAGDGYWPRRYYEQGLTQEFDPTKVGSWNELYPAFRDFASKNWAGKSAGKIIAFPGTWGIYQATVLTDKLPQRMTSWQDLWKPELKGRVMLTASGNENIALSALASGTSLNKVYHLGEGELGPIVDKLIQLKPNVRKVYLNVDEIASLMKQQDAWVAITWSSAIANMLNMQNISAEAYVPGGKSVGWVNCIMLSAESKHKEAALELLQWIYSADMRRVRWDNLSPADHVSETNQKFVESLVAAGGNDALTVKRMDMQTPPDFSNMAIQEAPEFLSAYVDGWNKWLAAQ
ncbi:extracellular solute-binding protein [Mesorhizobium sp. M3A.F.Ca.ET.201.01.1.1]|uniref:ABC transporter substrate-binding protein n=1 Tax=Mesorhizobium sp. M3A.F.Ca.ET.201.01.1.1 TaxID=2563946 RepID=UPI0010936190|nr:PotD/PotF family extracellular solute-binding protein [Mesorhizobium sp. M3A.F.Ca.ET.201.01.1.1]TGS71741.1 extracellular solute-binding protein [Mesorhizobium sp. M3A.F.Ca.ET.201.01.1.1]